MIDDIKSFIENNNFSYSKIVVAISGGPDSVCLLVQLNKIKELCNLELSAAYVNHGIRTDEENSKDFNLIKKLCEELHIPLIKKEYMVGELEQIARMKGIGAEAVAREARYEFFNTLITDNRSYLALGHNRDDQIETQIMRYFQGSSTEGLLGIKAINGRYIRPMMTIRKQTILETLQQEHISYNIDRTNLENNYLRNSIRNRLIPLIAEIFPGYVNSLKKIGDEFTLIHNILNSSYDSEIWKKRGNVWVIDYSFFIAQNLYLKKKYIYNIFDKTYVGDIKDYRLPDRFLKPLNKESYRNREIILEGHGFTLQRDQDELIWSLVNKNNYITYYEVFKPQKIRSNDIEITIKDIVSTGDDKKGLTFPFVIRSSSDKDKKILKRYKLPLDYSNTFIIEKSYNNIYAIINNYRLINMKYKNMEGVSINIIKL